MKITKIAVIPQVAWGDGLWAFPEHDLADITPNKAPPRVGKLNLEAQDVTPIPCGALHFWNSKHEACPQNLRSIRHAALPVLVLPLMSGKTTMRPVFSVM